MKCRYCGKELRVIWSSHRFTSYIAPAQISPGKAGAFCNARTDFPHHVPKVGT